MLYIDLLPSFSSFLPHLKLSKDILRQKIFKIVYTYKILHFLYRNMFFFSLYAVYRTVARGAFYRNMFIMLDRILLIFFNNSEKILVEAMYSRITPAC